MEKSIVLHSIYIEDLFEWMYKHVIDDGGDGDATLVCENYLEAASSFKYWLQTNNKPQVASWRFEHYEDKKTASYYDHEEAFIFCDNINVNCFGYKFIVLNDCFSYNRKLKTIKGIKNES